ncbi:MAG TPA: hypothetical protein VJJ70_00955 [Anaerolineales bacterium]|nr:hypothetical protein [Anaerolineales bacterium]
MVSAEADLITDVARLVAAEDAKSFKIVLVGSARTAGTLIDLLIHAHGFARRDITRLGNLATDEQNAAQLRKRAPVVVSPEGILANRGGTFYPPPGTTQVVIIQAVEAPAKIRRQDCGDGPLTLTWS